MPLGLLSNNAAPAQISTSRAGEDVIGRVVALTIMLHVSDFRRLWGGFASRTDPVPIGGVGLAVAVLVATLSLLSRKGMPDFGSTRPAPIGRASSSGSCGP